MDPRERRTGGRLMGDPTRLLSAGSDADELERALLTSLQDGPPADEKAALWQRLAVQAAAAAVVTGASSAAASPAAVAAGSKLSAHAVATSVAALLPKALAAKVTVGLVVTAAGLGGYALWDKGPTRDVPRAFALHAIERASRSPASAAAPAPPAVVPAEPPQASSPAKTTGLRVRRAVRPDALRAESELLAHARTDLRAGDVAAAQRSLTRLHRQFARGVLLQERELLEIELLSARGRASAARRRAEA